MRAAQGPAGTPTHQSARRQALAERAATLASHSVNAGVSAPVGAATSPSASPALAAMAAVSQATARVPYSVIVHSYSSLAFTASATQNSYEPGARVSLNATVAQSGLPTSGAVIWAEVTRPGGVVATLPFQETSPGEFSANYDLSAIGVYRFRVRARGVTGKGLPFTRERTVTAAAWRGGDSTTGPGSSFDDVIREHDARWCALLRCLTTEGGAITPELEKRLRAAGLNMDHLRKCLEKFCRSHEKPRPAGRGVALEDF